MSTKKVIRNIEAAINRVCEDIKQKQGGSGADKLDSLSKLVNSYSRLIERDKQKGIDPTMDGDPTYYKKLAADRTDRKGIIR
jgi:hypothetical protein